MAAFALVWAFRPAGQVGTVGAYPLVTMKTRNAPMPRLSASARRAGATKIARTTGSTFSIGYTPGTVDAVIAALSPLGGKIVCAGEGMGIFLTLG